MTSRKYYMFSPSGNGPAKSRTKEDLLVTSTPIAGTKKNVSEFSFWPSPLSSNYRTTKQNVQGSRPEIKLTQRSPERIKRSLNWKNEDLKVAIVTSDEEEESSNSFNSLSFSSAEDFVNDVPRLGRLQRVANDEQERNNARNNKENKTLVSHRTDLPVSRKQNQSPHKLQMNRNTRENVAGSSGKEPAVSRRNLKTDLAQPNNKKAKETELSERKRFTVYAEVHSADITDDNGGDSHSTSTLSEDEVTLKQVMKKQTSEKAKIQNSAKISDMREKRKFTSRTEPDLEDNEEGSYPASMSSNDERTSKQNMKKQTLKKSKVQSPAKSSNVRRKRKLSSSTESDPEDNIGDPHPASMSSNAERISKQDMKKQTSKKAKMQDSAKSSHMRQKRYLTSIPESALEDNKGDPHPASMPSNAERTSKQDMKKQTSKKAKMQDSAKSSRMSQRRNLTSSPESEVRRSKRNKFKPLESWRGERIRYKIGLDGCREIVGVSPGNPAFFWEKYKNPERRQDTFTPAEDKCLRRKFVTVPFKNNNTKFECFSTLRLETDSNDDNRKKAMSILTGLEVPGMSSGLIKVAATSEICDMAFDSNMVCFVLSGGVSVCIHKTTKELKRGECFFVPRGVHFFVNNTSTRETVLTYTMYE